MVSAAAPAAAVRRPSPTSGGGPDGSGGADDGGSLSEAAQPGWVVSPDDQAIAVRRRLADRLWQARMGQEGQSARTHLSQNGYGDDVDQKINVGKLTAMAAVGRAAFF